MNTDFKEIKVAEDTKFEKRDFAGNFGGQYEQT